MNPPRQIARVLMEPDFRLIEALIHSQQNFVLSDPSLPDNPIVYCSDGFCNLTGYKRSSVIGEHTDEGVVAIVVVFIIIVVVLIIVIVIVIIVDIVNIYFFLFIHLHSLFPSLHLLLINLYFFYSNLSIYFFLFFPPIFSI